MSFKSNQEILMEMIEKSFPSIHQRALRSEVMNYPVRKVYYISVLTDVIKYPDVWDINYMKIANGQKYRTYMKDIRAYVKDNHDLIAFMEL